ncbi:hypothetical protein, partial [Burkholderia sp. Ac-20349]|uniref:hypothetical protein n=1 Tax=Burkholderia sp. Ac-20349 TaxID=2703893 RepID=UPI00197C1703
IVGGPLAGALIELDGSLGFHGWQWLFVVEGIPAILLAFVVWTSSGRKKHARSNNDRQPR